MARMIWFESLAGSSILLYCIVVSAVLVYLPFMVVGYARFSVGYDMSAPRAMFDKLPAYAQRATWAHQNSFEAFGLFSAAALMAYVTHAQGTVVSGMAIAHVVARLLYSAFYIADIPILRSLMFAVGSVSTFTLFAASLLAVS